MLAKPSLADRLREPDPRDRAAALEEISLRMDDALASDVLAIAESDEPEQIRADAVISLGPTIDESGGDDPENPEFPDALRPQISRSTFEEIGARLRALHDDPSQPTLVRRRALEVLVRDPQPWHGQAVRDRLASGVRDWRLTAIFSMGYVPGFENEILETLETEEGDFLLEAVRAAAARGLEDAAERVSALARDPATEREVRLAAIDALPWLTTDCADLLEELAASDDEEIALAADDALDELAIHGDDEEDDDL